MSGRWAPPFVAGLTNAGDEAITFVHTGASFAPQAVAADAATFVEYLDAGTVRLLG